MHLLPLYILGWGLNCGFKNQDRLVVCYLPQKKKKKKKWSPYYIYFIDFLDWLPSRSGLIMFMPCVSFCCYISSFLFSYRLRNFLRKQHEKLPMKACIFSLMIIVTRALTPDMNSLPNYWWEVTSMRKTPNMNKTNLHLTLSLFQLLPSLLDFQWLL